MTSWVVDLAGGGTCAITAENSVLDGGALLFSNVPEVGLTLPLAIFGPREWRMVREINAPLAFTAPPKPPPPAEPPLPRFA